jgi:protein gp37
MTARFDHDLVRFPLPLTNKGKFTGKILTRPDRLSIPLKRRKPTVYAVWNDLFHEAVPFEFILAALAHAVGRYDLHKYLVLTKRPARMVEFFRWMDTAAPFRVEMSRECWWSGLTICNQQEADEKIPVFLQVPGRRFLSIEPMIGPIDIQYGAFNGADSIESLEGIHAVLLGGETGPGARPLHPDWVRSVRDQCVAAGVPFFFKSWGDNFFKVRGVSKINFGSIRTLDGVFHDELPWVKP